MELDRRGFLKGAALAGATVAGSAVIATPAFAAGSGSASALGSASGSASASGSMSGTAASGSTSGAAISWLPEKWDYEADVVVVGYGCCGASAAIEAADNGASVVILESQEESEAGGDLSLNAGYSELGVRGGYNMTADEVKVGTMGRMSDEDIQTYLTFEDRVQEIEQKIGSIQVGPDINTNPDAMLYVQNPDDPNAMGNTGWYWYTLFEAAVAERSDLVTVLYETPGLEVIQNPVTKEVVGVKGGTADAPIYVKANLGVLLCTGGFESDPALYDGTYSVGLYTPTCGHPANTGGGLKMGLAAGASHTHISLATEYLGICFKQASQDAGTAISFGQGVGGTNDFQASYIVVNREGKRFDDETKDWMHRHDSPNHWLDVKGAWFDSADQQYWTNSPAWLILDQAAIDSGCLGRHRGNGGWGYNVSNPNREQRYEWSEDNSQEIENGYLIKADSIEELCSKLTGVDTWGNSYSPDPDGIQAALEAYNTICGQAADAASAAAAITYFDGDYTSTQTGKNGDFEIDVTVTDGKVASVTIGDNQETPAIGGEAIKTLPDEIVAANGTTGVDVLAGATLTSTAILNGVDACLAQAISGGAAGAGVADASVIDEFGRTTFQAISTDGPFYGAEVCMGTIYTIGGLDTDIHSNVVGWDGNPIARLYAGGDCGSPFVMRTPATHGATATALMAVDHMLTLDPVEL